ncbi:unnamed protein product [Calypogeia fissa]
MELPRGGGARFDWMPGWADGGCSLAAPSCPGPAGHLGSQQGRPTEATEKPFYFGPRKHKHSHAGWMQVASSRP